MEPNQQLNPNLTPSEAPIPPISPAPVEVNNTVLSVPIVAPIQANHVIPTVTPSTEPYISNPFLVSTDGLARILRVNPGPALLAVLYILLISLGLGIVAGILGTVSPVVTGLLMFIGMILLLTVFNGMFYIIAGASANNEEVKLNSAFSKALSRFFPLLGLTIVTAIMISLGLILLVIPGLYLLARSALAPIVLFEENLGPIASIKRSFALTKGHVFEVLSALLAGEMLTGGNGLLSFAASAAPLTGRYRGLKALKDSGSPKPKTHWLNFLIPIVIVVFLGIYVGLVIFVFSQTKGLNTKKKSSYDTYNMYDYSNPSTIKTN